MDAREKLGKGCRMSMRKLHVLSAPLLGLALVVGSGAALLGSATAEAKGCIKGAVVGGVAGHVAGHHAVVGAAAGCVVGHHLAKKKQQEQLQQQRQQHQQQSPPAGQTGARQSA